ncbi:MAG TPA: hypothetical protein VNZ03_36395 [Terriglobales bacterium]|jgi:hypothetical protein|nr:hypothetical protein [Terriglobales bacterium]
MRITSQSLMRSLFAGMMFAAVALLSIFPAQVQAQSQGNNAVYDSTGTTITYSWAFVDASVFSGTGVDFCGQIYSALGAIPASAPGGVIDARGVQISGGNSCTNAGITDTPWQQGSTLHTKPSVILLPAGTITIGYSWRIPDRTRIIGEGAASTVLKAGSGLGTGSMVRLGDSDLCSPICFGIGVENLALDGSSSGVSGISNQNSQERTYVDRVNLTGISGTGLYVGTTGEGQNSGPYSNIAFSSSGSSAICAQILGSGPTRGIHNLSCTDTNGTLPGVAIYLDAHGNSIENVSVGGFKNGIVLGSDTSSCGSTPCRAKGNVLVNIAGNSSISGMSNVVHICGSVSATVCPNRPSDPTVTDLTVLGVTKNGATNAIDDDNIPVPSPGTATKITDATVAIYAVGDDSIAGSTAFTRFTTASGSTSVPTWLLGNSAVLVGSSCQPGTIYTNRSSSGIGTTLYACTSSGWAAVR